MAKHRFFAGLPPKPKAPAQPLPDASGERLQKVLSAAGLGSRRKCEAMIQEGRVEIDGRVVTQLGTKVDPERQRIIVDGEPIRGSTMRVCYLVNKPTGVVSTNYDQAGRPRVIDLVPEGEHLYTIGRLDMYSEGLILVTNDGELTNRLAHPRYGVEKTYQALIAGEPDPKILDRLRKGVHLAEGVAKCKDVRVLTKHGGNTLLEIVLDEGRNREIRRLLARVGHKVLKLKRMAIGTLKVGDLPPGAWRPLTSDEIARLHKLGEATAGGKRRGKPARARSGQLGAPRRHGDKQIKRTVTGTVRRTAGPKVQRKVGQGGRGRGKV